RLDALFDCDSAAGTAIERPGSCLRALGGLSRQDQDGSGTAFGYSGTVLTGGLAGQIDLGDDWTLGGVLGYENADFSGERGYGGADGDTLFAGLSVTRAFG
ncbi:autotransporter domain-containing protein, partial [Paralimibaculum aggregatum]|uniref:autotransporter domain-containing protein n=1 Tax=Paralimibaculum aggregatum TaxID=3036245 RepID=UPI002552C0FF